MKEKLNRWREKYIKSSKRKKDFKTTSGIEIRDIYTPLDIESVDHLRDIGFPGEYPFTRGIQPTMYRGRLWTMRQYAGFGTAEESNRRYRYLLEQGQTGLSVAFDLPTQMGYDSDHPISKGEIGKVGVAIDSLEDMEILFDSIPLDRVSTSMTINATASIILAMYIALAEKEGIDLNLLNGTIQNDILKEYIARGTYIYPPEPSLRIITNIFKFCKENLKKWNVISISGYHIREAGANAVQEVAFTLANGIVYVDTAIKAGLKIEDFAPRLSFFFNSHNNFLEEIAKFRAARRLWAKIMKDRFKAKTERACMLRFHTQTGGSTLTAAQPYNNIVRVTIQALAAVLGGTQSLHTNSMDEALSLPTEESARTALRTQQIIAYESGLGDVIDPLAGSYFIEALTNEIEDRANKYIETIDSMGGMVKAIESGYIQKEIEDSAYSYQKAIEDSSEVIVGVNKFVIEEESPKNLLVVNPEVERIQIERLRRLKLKRNNKKVEESLCAIKEAAKGTDNLMPFIIEAVKSYATLGEIVSSLKEIFGEYRGIWS
jgi:methylmalonyl-CoA mutase N-terminal domain/subunit